MRNQSVETDFYFLFLILDYDFKKKTKQIKNPCILMTPPRKNGQKWEPGNLQSMASILSLASSREEVT